MFKFLIKLHHNGRSNIYVIYKVQFDFALEVWFTIFVTLKIATITRFTYISKRQSDLAFSQGFDFHETSPSLAKISEFTVK